jgi:hypothetical protein
VGFVFLNQVIPSPVQHSFFLIFHIHRLQIFTHINQPSYPWSSRPSASFVFHSNIPYTIVEESILGMCLNCLIPRPLIHLTMSAPLFIWSSSASLRVLPRSPAHSGPDIFRKICLSYTRTLTLLRSLTEKPTTSMPNKFCWNFYCLLFPRNQKARHLVLKNLEPVKTTWNRTTIWVANSLGFILLGIASFWSLRFSSQRVYNSWEADLFPGSVDNEGQNSCMRRPRCFWTPYHFTIWRIKR